MFIEQVNGQLKNKFPCLKVGLRITPVQSCRTIIACAVLFNIAKDLQEPEHENVHQVDDDDPPVVGYEGEPRAAGLAVQAQIVDEIFNT